MELQHHHVVAGEHALNVKLRLCRHCPHDDVDGMAMVSMTRELSRIFVASLHKLIKVIEAGYLANTFDC